MSDEYYIEDMIWENYVFITLGNISENLSLSWLLLIEVGLPT